MASIINNLRRKKYRQRNNRGKINDIKNPRDYLWKTTARHFVIELFKAELSRPAVVSPHVPITHLIIYCPYCLWHQLLSDFITQFG